MPAKTDEFLFSPLISTEPSRSKDDSLLKVVVSCASGFEALLLQELEEIFSDNSSVLKQLKLSAACVELACELQDCYRICLWSRIAEQVLVSLCEIELPEKTSQQEAREALYQSVKQLPWESLFDVSKSIHIESSGKQAVFHDEGFARLIVKDAIVDRFRFALEKRPDVSSEADIRINLFAQERLFVVQLNLAGERLHRRSYRQQNVEAPLRETLAAALLRQIAWQEKFRQAGYFLDPCCGSGTIVIEALMVAADMAPGLLRAQSRTQMSDQASMSSTAFAFENLKVFDMKVWKDLVQEAEERFGRGRSSLSDSLLRFRGYDSDSKALTACQKNLELTGLGELVHLEKRSFFQLSGLKVERDTEVNDGLIDGVLLANPPYGERLQEGEGLKYLYRFLGERLAEDFVDWDVGIICNEVEYLDALGFRDFEQARFYNGNLKCLFRCSHINKAQSELAEDNYFSSHLQALMSRSELEKLEIDPDAEAFKNRLVKNLKNLSSWLKDSTVQNFRLYDSDIPEFNFAIDCYQGKTDVFLLVYEYAPPKSVDPELAKKRLNLALQTLRKLFSLQREQIFIKTRRQQKGKTQYQAKEKKGSKLLRVHEDGLNFLINPVDYLDTGLFLDHRLIRKQIRSVSKGKRFLNLFCYTGSATVFALAGGAKNSTSIDLSANYLSWAKNNVLANGFSLDQHRFIKSDVLRWLKQDRGQYDIIFIDPPTFSNTSKKGLVFDVQKQHEELITLAMARLEKQGVLYFSCNFGKFIFSSKLEKIFQVKEISADTSSPDFSRKQAHRSWQVRFPD